MGIPRSVYIFALIITLVVISAVFSIGAFFDRQREIRITQMEEEMFNNLNEMQTFTLMSEVYGDTMACLAFKNTLQKLDKSVWDLGMKIDQYRIASEEFQKDKFYLLQKKSFNEKEVFYLMLLSKIKKHCSYGQAVVSFFYKNAEDCKKCDDQSFVLTDIKKASNNEVSIFSFDVDLGLSSINLLATYYEIDEFPCLIINEKKHCGMLDKEFIVQKICIDSPTASLCKAQ